MMYKINIRGPRDEVLAPKHIGTQPRPVFIVRLLISLSMAKPRRVRGAQPSLVSSRDDAGGVGHDD